VDVRYELQTTSFLITNKDWASTCTPEVYSNHCFCWQGHGSQYHSRFMPSAMVAAVAYQQSQWNTN